MIWPYKLPKSYGFLFNEFKSTTHIPGPSGSLRLRLTSLGRGKCKEENTVIKTKSLAYHNIHTFSFLTNIYQLPTTFSEISHTVFHTYYYFNNLQQMDAPYHTTAHCSPAVPGCQSIFPAFSHLQFKLSRIRVLIFSCKYWGSNKHKVIELLQGKKSEKIQLLWNLF